MSRGKNIRLQIGPNKWIDYRQTENMPIGTIVKIDEGSPYFRVVTESFYVEDNKIALATAPYLPPPVIEVFI